MEERFNRERLRKLLNEAKGDEPQYMFANRCGIGASHLNRMLNDDASSRPSKTILKRIADNAGIDYEALLDACGYTKPTQKLRRSEMPMRERAERNAEDMKEGFHDMVGKSSVYRSLEDFLEDYDMFYGKEDVKFHIGKEQEYEGSLVHGAECYVKASAVFGSGAEECRTFFVIYYCRTIGGQAAILHVGMEGKYLLEAGVISEETISSRFHGNRK